METLHLMTLGRKMTLEPLAPLGRHAVRFLKPIRSMSARRDEAATLPLKFIDPMGKEADMAFRFLADRTWHTSKGLDVSVEATSRHLDKK